MANEFKVKKGLIVNGSGSTLLDIQGAQGQVFSVTDSLSGSLFGVSDISGIPIFEVLSDETIILGTSGSQAILISGSHATVSGSFSGSFVGDGSSLSGLSSGAVTAINNAAANRLTTIASTTTQLDAEANLTFDGTSILHVNHTSGQLKLGADVTLFRDGANILRTDDAFHANANIHVGGDGKIFDRAGTNSFIHFDHGNSKIRIQENGEEMITVDSGNVTINAAEGSNSFKVFASSSSPHFFVSSSGMTVINNGTADYFGSSTRVQIASGEAGKAVGIRSSIFYLYSYGNNSTAQFTFGDGSANWGLFANDTNFKLYDYSIAGPALTVSAGGNLFGFNSGSLKVYIGQNLSESTAEGRLKIYNRGNDGIISTYHYNSSLELRSGISGSGYVHNWSRILLKDDQSGTGNIAFFVSGSEKMRINNSGSVGIGTSTPGDLLHIHATGNGYKALIIEDDARRLELGRDMIAAKSADGSTVQALFINPAGNTGFASNSGGVGIGTTGPKSGDKLFIKGGNLRVEGASATSDLILDHSGQYSGSRIRGIRDTGTDGQDFGSSMLQFLTNDNSTTSATVAMTINSEGKVGINSTDPVELLDVAGTARVETGIVEGTIYVGNDIQHWGDGGTGIFFSGSTATSNDVITLKTAAAERLRVDASGIVTINNTGEQGWSGNKLNVGDTGDAASGINILTSATGNAYILFSDVVDNSATEYANQIRFSHTDSFLSTNIGGTEIMRLSGSGAVGIGTVTPLNDLDIFNTGNAGLRVKANGQATIIIDSDSDNSGAAGAYLSYRDTGATKWVMYKETNNDFYLYNAVSNSYPIHAKAGGDIVLMEDGSNLGIGKGTPASKLDVSGSIRAHTTTASKYIELFGGNSGNFIDSYANNLYLRYGGDTGKSIMLDGNGDVTFSDRAIFPSSNGSTASPTIAFPSHSTANHAGIYYNQANQYLMFRAANGDRAYVGAAGIFSNSNVYSGTSGQFRNYGGVWKATTGTSGNGFNFTSADVPNAVTITGTASNVLKITGSGTQTGIKIEIASGSSASTAMLTHLRQSNGAFSIEVDENQNGGKTFNIVNSGSIRLNVGVSSTLNYNTFKMRNSTSGNNPPEIHFDRGDTSIVDGNNLGAIVARGKDPSSYNAGAQIKFKADGTWDTNDYPSRIEFATDQGGTMTNILVLDSNQASSFTGNVTVTGNLTVTGTTTTVNAENLDLSDNIIGLNRGTTNSGSHDSGIIIERGTTGDNAAFLWDESADRFIFGTTAATASDTGNISYTYAPFSSNALWTDSSAIAYWGNANTAYGVLTWDTSYASIYASSGKRLRLGSHNSQGVMVVSSSKVGIGTEAPHGSATKLHVHGGDILQSGSTANNLVINDGANIVGSNHLFLKGNGSYVQIRSSGNFIYLDGGAGQVFRNGSGTQYGHFRTNNYLFNTGSASAVGGSAFMTLNVGATTNKPISIVNDATDGMYIRRYDSSGKYQLQTTVAGGNSGVLSLQTYGGDVGIGTTSPYMQLNVNSAANGVTAIGVSNSGSGASRVYLDASNGDFAGSDYMWIGQNNDLSGEIFMAQNAGSFHIKTQPSGTSTTQFTVTQAGNVGIGTTSPSQTLEVHSTIKIGETGVTGGRLISGDSMIFQIDSDASSGTSSYRFRANGTGDDGTELMRITEDGTVAIGTATATSSGKLTIQSQGADNSDQTALVLRNYSAGTFAGRVTTEYEVGTVNIAEVSAVRVDSNNGQLRFKTKQGGTIADVLTMDQNATASFAGIVKAATTFIADAVDPGNPVPGSNNVRVSGYGLIGNRGNVYITNANTDVNAALYFGVGAAHAGATKLIINPSNSIFSTNIRAGADSTYDIGTSASRFKDAYIDSITLTGNISSSGNGIFDKVGIGTSTPQAKLDVTNGSGKFCVDSKSFNVTDSFTTCLTVGLNSHTGCHVVITCFGDWGSHSTAAYRGEFFLQNGANGYNEPGMILKQDDNTGGSTATNKAHFITCQIVDPTGTGNPKDFSIQMKHTDTGGASFTGTLTYTVQGKFNTVT